MDKKLLYTSPTCETMLFLEKGMVLNNGSLSPLTDDPDTIEWLSPVI